MLQNVIELIIDKHENRPPPPPGYKYRRNSLDKMIEEKQINKDFFNSHIEKILIGKSELKGNQRRILTEIFSRAVTRTIELEKSKTQKPN